MTVSIDLNKLLHVNQISIVNNLVRVNVIRAGRRFGKTRLAIIYTLAKALSRKGVYWWISPTFGMGTSAWRVLKSLSVQIPNVDISETYRTVTLLNGSIIEFRSADKPDNLRGEGLAGLVVDEAAMVKESAWNEALRPSLMDSQGWAIFISTPKGRNWFYHLYLLANEEDDWRTFHRTSYDNPHLDKTFIDEERKNTPEDVFRQEILAEFLENEGAVFRNITPNLWEPTIEDVNKHRKHTIVAGVDLGKKNDYTVFSIGCSDCNKELILYRDRKIDYTYHKKRLIAFHERYKFYKVVVEANAMGEPIIEDLRNRGLPIEPFNTTNTSKARVIENLKLMLEDSRWKLINDKSATNELQAFEMSRTSTGKPKYSAPEGLHDDTVIARALMIEAGEYTPLVFI